MNKKGMEVNANIGMLVMAAVAIIIGAAIFSGAIAPSVGTMTQTRIATNLTYTMPAVGSSIDLAGATLVGTPIMTNATNGSIIPANNYSIVSAVSPTDGVLSVRLYNLGGSHTGRPVNISYVYGDDGYVGDSGGRAVSALIPIAMALALIGGAFLAINFKDIFG